MISKDRNYKPYIAAVMWAVLLALCLLRYAEPIKDGDLLWHIRYGQYHVQNKTMLMDHSAFSWTPAAKNATYCTWAADVALYALFKIGGLPLLYVFLYACLFFPVVMAGIFARKVGIPTHGFTLAVLIILLLSISDASFIKPEVISLVYFTLIAVLYFNMKNDPLNEKKGLLCLFFPMIFLFWANMHGVFFMGLGFLGLLVVGEMVNYLIKSKYAFSRKTLVYFMISGVLSIAAVFLTPYGVDLIHHIINLATSGVPDSVVANSLSYQTAIENIWIYGVERNLEFTGIMVVSFVVLFIVNFRKNRDMDVGILLPTIFMVVLNLKFLRASFYWPPFWTLSVFYLASRERTDLIARVKFAKPVARWGFMAVLAALAIYYPTRSIYNRVYSPSRWSYFGHGYFYGLVVQESAFLKMNNIGNKIFNSYNAGSYLLFDLWPERKVFIDIRNFPYLGNIWEVYLKFRDGKISLKEMEDKFGFDTAVLSHDELVMLAFLDAQNWRAVYYGTGGIVMVNDEVKFSQDFKKLDRRRFDGLKNLAQAASVVRTAQNLNDLDTADYVLDIMKNKLSYQKHFDFYYPYCGISQEGLRAFNKGDYDHAIASFLKVGFNKTSFRLNQAFRTSVYHKVAEYVEAERYKEALPLIGRLLNYLKEDGDVMYNAGMIAYLASKQAEKDGDNVKIPSWRSTLDRLLEKKPDYRHADIAKKLLRNEINDEELSLIKDTMTMDANGAMKSLKASGY